MRTLRNSSTGQMISAFQSKPSSNNMRGWIHNAHFGNTALWRQSLGSGHRSPVEIIFDMKNKMFFQFIIFACLLEVVISFAVYGEPLSKYKLLTYDLEIAEGTASGCMAGGRAPNDSIGRLHIMRTGIEWSPGQPWKPS